MSRKRECEICGRSLARQPRLTYAVEGVGHIDLCFICTTEAMLETGGTVVTVGERLLGLRYPRHQRYLQATAAPPMTGVEPVAP